MPAAMAGGQGLAGALESFQMRVLLRAAGFRVNSFHFPFLTFRSRGAFVNFNYRLFGPKVKTAMIYRPRNFCGVNTPPVADSNLSA